MRPRFVLKMFLAAVAMVGTFTTVGRAQTSVPGGWDSQFGYQSFSPLTTTSGASFGYGQPGFGTMAFPFGYGISPFGTTEGTMGPIMPRANYSSNGVISNAPLTVEATSPLIHTIRQTVRPSRRR